MAGEARLRKTLQDSAINAVGRGLYQGQWKHLGGSQQTRLERSGQEET